MYCVNCGAALFHAANYCVECGRMVVSVTPQIKHNPRRISGGRVIVVLVLVVLVTLGIIAATNHRGWGDSALASDARERIRINIELAEMCQKRHDSVCVTTCAVRLMRAYRDLSSEDGIDRTTIIEYWRDVAARRDLGYFPRTN
jgi:hypothetical protein